MHEMINKHYSLRQAPNNSLSHSGDDLWFKGTVKEKWNVDWRVLSDRCSCLEKLIRVSVCITWQWYCPARTVTSDRTLLGPDQLLKCLGFSLFPYIFPLNSILLILISFQPDVIYLFMFSSWLLCCYMIKNISKVSKVSKVEKKNGLERNWVSVTNSNF